jgi:tight adherence protein C
MQDPSQVSQLKAKLIQAGFYGRDAITLYLGARTLSLVGATLAVLLLMPWALRGGGMVAFCMAAVLAVAGIMGPDQVLKQRRQAREIEYREGFPDLLDLLVASVEAGLSLDAAVSRVTEELERRYPNLAVHMRVLTLELRAGRARKDAWAGLAERLGIDEATSLATMLRQAEEMGTSLGETLAVFSDDMRQKRMLRAEEKAMALPAKMMIPLILFIFPCLMGVLIMPAAFNIARTLGGH